MAAIPKPFQISTETLYSRFNASKTDDEVRAYVSKLKTKGVGLFDSVNRSVDATPAKVLLSQDRSGLLWEFLDGPDYSGLNLTQVHGKMSANLIGVAAKVNNTKFIKEWAKRGLPMQDASWKSTPLALAINHESTTAVIALSESGADWFGNYGAETAVGYWKSGTGWSMHRSHISRTSAWALALASQVSEITKMGLEKKSTLSDADWNLKVFLKKSEGPEIVKLRQLIGEILGPNCSLTLPPEKEDARPGYNAVDRYKESWWRVWRLSGVMDQFKTTPEGQDINWAKVYDGKSVPNHVYRALAVGVEKPVTVDALRQCVAAFAERKNKNVMLSHMTAPRAKALWSETGPLAAEVKAKFVKVGSYHQDQMMRLYPSVVLRNLRTPMLWKDGADNPELAKQFWETLSARHLNEEDDRSSKRVGSNHSASRYGIPEEFNSAATKSQRQAAYKALDALAQVPSVQASLPDVLKHMISTPNKNIHFTTNEKPQAVVSGTYLLEIAVPILWGIERGLLNAKHTHELVLASKRDTSTYQERQWEEWVAQIERYRLTEKVAKRIDIPRPTFEGAL